MTFRSRTPLTISKQISSFCKSICPSQVPLFVDFKPELHAQISDCFPTVERKVKECGGKIQYGWEIWEWPNILIEAEFHAVWCMPDGNLLDITPKLFDIEKILFLPDSNTKYQGKQIDNIRISICDNSITNDLINISKAIFRFENKGEREYQHGMLSVEGDEATLYQWLLGMKKLTLNMIEKGLNRNSLCLCGSGNKYKSCHGKKLDKKLIKIK